MQVKKNLFLFVLNLDKSLTIESRDQLQILRVNNILNVIVLAQSIKSDLRTLMFGRHCWTQVLSY